MYDIAKVRAAFTRKLESSQILAPRNAEHPDIFHRNLEAAIRVQAYDAAVKAAAHALKVNAELASRSDLERIRALLRKSRIKYIPAQVRGDVRVPATAEIE